MTDNLQGDIENNKDDFSGVFKEFPSADPVFVVKRGPGTPRKVVMELRKRYPKKYDEANHSNNENVYTAFHTEVSLTEGLSSPESKKWLQAMASEVKSICATTGRVIVCGHDVKYDLNKVRKSIGICPQNDLLFTELTVVEHLIFFGRLKKMSKETVYEEALSLLQSFNLHNQKDLFVFQLSSGMRRKLSVIIALIGSPKVLLMDDPTSRLDIESRRLVWDRLLSLKNSRVIILNTQCMEEADMFADRIAILNQGRLMCYGTPAFLKKEYGTRHQLVLNFNRDNAVHHNEITSIVKGIIPRARLHHNDGDSITFLLPQETKLLFPSLLEALEANFDKLHIAHMKFSFSTIEEVYLRINNIMSKSFYQILNGAYVFYTQPNIKYFFISDNEYNFKPKHFDLRKNMLESLELNFNVYPTSKVYYSLTYTDFKPKLEVVYYNLLSNYTSNIYKVENVREALIQEGQQNIRFYWDHLIVAAEFNKTGAENFVITALYSCNAVHGAPISYLLVLNTAIRAFVNPDASIKCFNSPFPTPFGFDPKVEKFGEHWYIVFSSAILYYSGKFLVFPVTEKVLTTKHLQLMSGLHIFVYWTVCYIWDLIILLIVIIAVLSVIGLYGVYRTCVFCGEDEMTFETCSRAPSYYYGKWAITPNILIMSISILLYLIILYKLETDAYFKWKEKVFSNSYINKSQHSEEEREEVKNESDRVSNIYQVEMKNFGRVLLPYNAPNDLGLEEISDTLCKHYSKIDKRKLSIGIALIGSPLIVLLDEPTIGMDPESCQNVWNIINFVLKQPNSPCVVIASQNTVECEKLCDNVCIIKTGKIEYFGKLSDLKQKYGKGFIIKLKLNLSLKQYFEKITDSAATLSIISTESISNLFYSIDDKRVIHLMSDIALMYSGLCLLKHTHINSLHYYIEETKKWSEIFTEIEELKKCHPIVEDYQISEHSLDDIFLSVIQRT
ncbi:hypothetical protein RN001_000032 [Aquatica leii]|uniref:ABC transporter domain-containing protein n=1 Tax=Aquatica leii TaxID=1421715 RepID=A0AAN7PLR4_9COLE|nr:hypothetical protein RN001_000032 [Aquatica leii]